MSSDGTLSSPKPRGELVATSCYFNLLPNYRSAPCFLSWCRRLVVAYVPRYVARSAHICMQVQLYLDNKTRQLSIDIIKYCRIQHQPSLQKLHRPSPQYLPLAKSLTLPDNCRPTFRSSFRIYLPSRLNPPSPSHPHTHATIINPPRMIALLASEPQA
jgi:hypothetical protein